MLTIVELPQAGTALQNVSRERERELKWICQEHSHLSMDHEPPTKRRRFFTDPEDDTGSHLSSPVLPTPPTHQKTRFFQSPPNAGSSQIKSEDAPAFPSSPIPARGPLVEQSIQDASNRSAPLETSREEPVVSFDQEMFESFVGAKVAKETMNIIRENCGDNLERAVNMYFDGTWKDFKKKNPSINAFVRPPPAAMSSTPEPTPKDSPKPVIRRSMPESRYVGAFGVEGWATRSGTNLLKHGDVVKIERKKMQLPKAPRSAKGAAAVHKLSAAAVAKRDDTIVRFTTSSGTEIGRLVKDTASWVSTLIDQRACKFEGTVVYAPDTLRTNDTIFIQLRCSLLATAFHSRAFQLEDNNRSTAFFDQGESMEEKDLRMRQVALVRLFQEVNLDPVQSNAASSKQQRQELLQAAEMEEKKEKETAKAAATATAKDQGSSPQSDEEEGEELEQDQLDTLYKKAQSFDFNTPEAEPADTFAMSLRPYQKQALHWMISKEKDLKSNREPSMHPLWEEYAWPTKDFDDKDLPQVDGQPNFYVNPYSGDLSLDFPTQEQHCLGGILADEMGLGKTIQMLSLVHTHRSEISLKAKAPKTNLESMIDLPRLTSSANNVLQAPCTTLVVAPMSLLAQWQSEADKASKEGSLKTLMYYGADKANSNLQALCCEASAASAPDVVITSYGVILSEFTQLANKKGDRAYHNGIFSLNFFRVILDEGHNIKNRQSKTAKACYEIAAEHRWVLTGTPIVNRLEDLFSLVRFLRVEPWNNFSFWRTFITVPFESKNFMRALDVVQTVLEPLKVEIVGVKLGEAERGIYDYIFLRAKQAFSKNMEAGTVMKSFTSIFAQILRLRQSCCHPILVRNKDVVADEEEAGAAADLAAGLADDMDLNVLIEHFSADTSETETNPNAFGAHVLGQIRDEEASECPICSEEPMIEQTVTGGCWHSACKKCLLDYMKHQTDRHKVPTCPNCRAEINYRDLFEVVRDDSDLDMFQKPRISLQRVGKNSSSAKVVALIRALRELRREHPRMKSVVFSQFTSFLTLIEPALAKSNIKFLRLDGTMAQKARAAVLNEFQDANQFTILLLSLRAGGVGLNLTTAKRVYMMDPWWSFAIEAQAIDRVHRMGQEDEVKVYRFIVEQSVEERMLKVQERKKFLATSLGMMSDEEKKHQRIEDIKALLDYEVTSH
ncbi:DNA repair protein RAD5 [Verticillium dahliae VdLs.17]|uniref:DNA repair protein RAD5 n=1 Tax=Verticillium dahliae (strain VdLs.17 / ATCC MYA-4575 / FGSC 10137) TaxID=498257 RepID=G2XHV5_VERDV|nr:DNA repair protein RAD5 [Verticillium dahliae VdLs.17]EGY19403.1 DNA repair protein RAD5 [Verticillium dahliae VdLs.17]